MLKNSLFCAGQSPIIFLALKDAESGERIAKSSIQSIRYYLTAEKIFNDTNYIPVADHYDESISNDCVYDSWQSSALCSIAGGYNFRWSPDCRDTPFFARPGNYRLVIIFEFEARNPAVESICFEVA